MLPILRAPRNCPLRGSLVPGQFVPSAGVCAEGALTNFKQLSVGCPPPHRQHGVAYVLRKLLIATVLVASMATPTASHAFPDLWDAKGEVVPKSEAPERKRGLWKSSNRPPAKNPSEPASVPTKPRVSSESANAPKRSSPPTDSFRIALRSPCLSILGPCI